MLGIGCPDRHALQHITSPKLRRPRRLLPSRERVRSSAHPRHCRTLRRRSPNRAHSGHSALWAGTGLHARGRVKRRLSPIIGKFTVVAGVALLRRLRIHHLKSNRIARFRQGTDFSHGLGLQRPFAAEPRRGSLPLRVTRQTSPAKGSGSIASSASRIVLS